MSGVILRCPNCGTGRATPGECDACHEADVRYFCTNHTPGLWLDGKACTRCGARFGQPAPATPAAPAAPAAAPRPSRPRPGSTGRAAPPRRPTEEVFGRLDEPPPRPRPPSLEEMLAEAVRAREAARPTIDTAPPGATPRALGGCLARTLIMLFVFVLMILSGIFMFAGSMFRVW
jgi:hypothetical protein